MAESTRAMRRSIYERDILPTFRNRLLTEITPEDLRAMCDKVRKQGAPATAAHVRDIVKLVFAFAKLHGRRCRTPPKRSGRRRSRRSFPRNALSLSPAEIRVMLGQLEHVATLPTIRLGLAVVPFGSPKTRLRVQQTQKSFSMIVSVTPRPAPVSPKRAARLSAGAGRPYPSISAIAPLAIETRVGRIQAGA